MAKRKNSVALFEVIHSDKRFGKKSAAPAQPLKTPSWWFKGKKPPENPAETEAQPIEADAESKTPAKVAAKVEPTPPPPVELPEPEVAPKVREKTSPLAFLKSNLKAKKSAPPPPEPESFEPEAVFAPDVSEDVSDDYSDPEPIPAPKRWRSKPAAKPVDLDLDPERQTISFRLTYTTALVGSFALLIIVILAFVIGQHLTRKSSPALTAMSTEDLRAQPPHEDVINVDPSTPTRDPKPPVEAQASPANPNPPKTATINEGPRAPKAYTSLGERQVGLNYVVVQSYPDEHDATKARDVLNQEGVLCTVEQGIPGWGKWYVVVGVQGFARIRTDEFKAYVASIQAVSKKFAGNSKFKQFDPQPYSWRQAKQ